MHLACIHIIKNKLEIGKWKVLTTHLKLGHCISWMPSSETQKSQRQCRKQFSFWDLIVPTNQICSGKQLGCWRASKDSLILGSEKASLCISDICLIYIYHLHIHSASGDGNYSWWDQHTHREGPAILKASFSLLLEWMNQSFLCRLSHFSTDWQPLCCCQEADCSSSASALCAAEPLGQWSLLPRCMWCVAPPAMLCPHPFLCQRFIEACCLFSVSHSTEFSNSATQQNGSDSGMFRLNIGDKGFLAETLALGEVIHMLLCKARVPKSAVVELLCGLKYCRLWCVRLWFY